MPAVKEKQSAFSNYSATHELLRLAETPIDLTLPNQMTKERVEKYCGKACGFKLLYGTERINDQVMNALLNLAKEAQVVEKMKRMQNGEIMNFIENFPSEKRQVLHTATRDFFEKPNPSLQAREAAHLARQEAEKLKSFIAKIELEKKFNELILIGIGGSDLGPRAHYTALEYLKKPNRKVHFISNVDPDDTAKALHEVNFKNCLVVVISKSGTTLETIINEEMVRERFKKEGLNPQHHFISVTCPNTPMDNKEKYLETFHLWEWVGGRFSTSSMCGGVVLAFAYGFDVFWEMLKGAKAMDLAALEPDIHKNLPLLSALLGIWNHNFLHTATSALIPYSQALSLYPAHIQQVEMESNGKRIDRHGNFVDFETGPILWGASGTNAQHSFFQLIHQGTATIPITFIGFKESQWKEDLEVEGTTSQEKLLSNLFAQAISLSIGQKNENPNKFFPGNRPTQILLGEQLTPFALGCLLAFFEHRAAFQGFIWNINSFDQEGVQLGKVLSDQVIDLFAVRRDKTQKVTPFPLGEAFLKQLEKF